MWERGLPAIRAPLFLMVINKKSPPASQLTGIFFLRLTTVAYCAAALRLSMNAIKRLASAG